MAQYTQHPLWGPSPAAGSTSVAAAASQRSVKAELGSGSVPLDLHAPGWVRDGWVASICTSSKSGGGGVVQSPLRFNQQSWLCSLIICPRNTPFPCSDKTFSRLCLLMRQDPLMDLRTSGFSAHSQSTRSKISNSVKKKSHKKNSLFLQLHNATHEFNGFRARECALKLHIF